MPHDKVNKNEIRVMHTRQLLLRSAEIVFVRDGYEMAELGEIASIAGRSKGAIYTHFESKEDLFLALYRDRNFSYRSRLQEALAGSASGERNLRVLRKFFISLLEDEAWCILVLEFKLYTKRHPESKEKFLKLYLDRTHPNTSEANLAALFGPPGKGAAYLSRSIALDTIAALLSALVIERDLAPSLKDPSVVKKVLAHLFDSLMKSGED